MSEFHNKERQYAQASAAILGYAKSYCPIDWRIWEWQDLYRSIEISLYDCDWSSDVCSSDLYMSCLNSPVPGMYISPSHQLATKTIIVTLKEMCQRAEIDYTYNQQRSEFTFHNWGGTIWLGSGDKPDSLRGPNIGWAVIDEPFIQKREVFEQMIARVRHPEATKSQIFLTGTPEQLNWGFTLANDPKLDLGIIQASTLDNPHLPDDYKESLLQAYSEEQIDAYVHGKFVNLTQGRVYKDFDREKHVVERPDLKNENLPIGIGMD